MATSFIGKPISLISHSDVRYRGILAGIDPAASTIQLSNVFSMGTESRRPADEYIPPVQEPYAFIIFRASEVKDLGVDEVAPPPMQRQRSVHDDPAVIGASAPAPAAQYNGFVPQPHVMPVPVPVAPPQQQRVPPQGPPPQMPTPQQQQPPQQSRQPSNRSNSVHTAAESLETVQRAIGEIRISQHNGGSPHQPHHHPQQQGSSGGGGGGRRGHHGGGGHHHHPKQQTHEIKVPNSDFDFVTSNAKFEKKRESSGEGDENKEKEKEKPAYDPSQSFFDSLSSGARNGTGAGGAGAPGGGQGGGRRGGGNAGRNRREEERERNVATFGEPGGVGLMGPGAYVGGWGGYGRRGGGRGRRGGGPSRGTAANPPAAAAGRS